ncbi:hypothetical protein V6N13_055815 [Hibiscus sabdariffa]
MVPRRCRALMLVALAHAGSIIGAILVQPHQDLTRVSRNVEHGRTDPVTSSQVVNFSAPAKYHTLWIVSIFSNFYEKIGVIRNHGFE